MSTNFNSIDFKIRLQLLWSKVIATSAAKIKSNDAKNRSYIISGYNETKDKEKNGKPKTVSSASQLYTTSLHRTRALLAQELERSNASLLAFEKSSGILRNTLDEYSVQNSSLKIGHRILGKLRQRDFTDRLLLAAGLSFVILVALSIVWSRLAPFFPAFTSLYAFTSGGIDKNIESNPYNMANTNNVNRIPTTEVKSFQTPIPTSAPITAAPVEQLTQTPHTTILRDEL